jgi:hypothetical protein
MHVSQSFFSGCKVAADGVHIMMDHTGRPSGQALVAFETAADAQEAMRLDKEKIGTYYYSRGYGGGRDTGNSAPPHEDALHITSGPHTHLHTHIYTRARYAGGRWIDLFPATMQEVQVVASGGNLGGGGARGSHYGGGGFGQYGGAFGRGGPPVGGSTMQGSSGPVSFQHVVKVRGLPFDCSRMDLMEFFKEAAPKENGIFFVSTPRKRGSSGDVGADGRGWGGWLARHPSAHACLLLIISPLLSSPLLSSPLASM